MEQQTPLMAQYRDIKSRYDDCVLLFRVGDFYETFYDDAVDVSRILNIALTTRDKHKPNPVPLAGVPFHAAENYITRLLAAGRKVAICEQVEDAAQAKGLVKRDVVEVLTPGTAMNSQLLESKENHYCLSLHRDGRRIGIAIVDVTTGEFGVAEEDDDTLPHLLQGMRIREVFVDRRFEKDPALVLVDTAGAPVVTPLDEDHFEPMAVSRSIERQFGSSELPGELQNAGPARVAAGAMLHHLQTLKGAALPQVVAVNPLAEARFLTLDEETIRNLELFEPLHGADRSATLIRLLDETQTPMGGRELRIWLRRPLADVAGIEERHQAVAELHGGSEAHERIRSRLDQMLDIPRLAARIAARKAIPRELHALRESLERLPGLREALSAAESPLLQTLANRIELHSELAGSIGRAIVSDPPGHLREGGIFRKGYAPELDSLITEAEAAKRWIAELERRERERTGITSLKVGFNKVFGYFIEVSKIHVKRVPEDYLAKQTLVNAERFYTSTLKEKEQLILESEERRVNCEQRLYEALCQSVAAQVPALQLTAKAVAQADALSALATVARRHAFRRPVVDESHGLELVRSRHPVLERATREAFVPNDLLLDPARRQFALITGPNMSGKSTFLRQVALCVVLAQMGSFLPADRARIGLVDQVFTRVGASDRLSRGESTFLVEMKETAYILEHMTDRSLVLLDEVGRGTSTYDGLSIAWAVTEYLLEGHHGRPKALFATHFHELTQLRSVYPRLVNLKITIREWEGGIIFLRKIVGGTSERSYGIHAARVAGLPAHVLKRAEEILKVLEHRRDLLHQGVDLDASDSGQISLFEWTRPRSDSSDPPDPPLEAVKRLIVDFDVDHSTPVAALQLLERLRKMLNS